MRQNEAKRARNSASTHCRRRGEKTDSSGASKASFSSILTDSASSYPHLEAAIALASTRRFFWCANLLARTSGRLFGAKARGGCGRSPPSESSEDSSSFNNCNVGGGGDDRYGGRGCWLGLALLVGFVRWQQPALSPAASTHVRPDSRRRRSRRKAHARGRRRGRLQRKRGEQELERDGEREARASEKGARRTRRP